MSELNQKKVTIIGAGAVGCLFGSRLYIGGAALTLYSPTHAEALKEHGVRIEGKWGDLHFYPDRVVDAITSELGYSDYILVTTKVLSDSNIVDLIAPIVGPDSVIVLIQNGIGIEAAFAKRYPNNLIISGLAFVCVYRKTPSVIIHQDYGHLVLGRYPSGQADAADQLAAAFSAQGVPAKVSSAIGKDRWLKLIWNASFNPLSVVAGKVTTDTLLKDPEMRGVIENVMKEVCGIASKEGYDLNETHVQKNIDDTLKMTPYKTSMLRDYEENRPLEVDAILGNAIKIAKRHRLEVPYLKQLYAITRMADVQRRG